MAFAYLFLNMGIAEDYTQTITWEKTGYMLAIFLAVYLTSQGKILKRA
jgi:hypothetical protein